MPVNIRVSAVVLVLGVITAPGSVVAQPQLPEAPLTLNYAVDLALRNHPAVRETRAGAAAATGEISVARTAYLPRLDVLWRVNRATRNNVFGLLLPQFALPPVSGPVLGTDTLQGVWSSAQYDRTAQTLQSQEARATAIMSAAFHIAANTPQQLQAARDTKAQAGVRYDAGGTTVVEVAEAQRLLAAAEAEIAVATLAVWRAILAEAILAADVQSFLNRTQPASASPAR